uniref:Aic1 n=1 Tax=Arundo donax TaxID=35708 RepID=A0A0A9F340_ARUDO
MAHMVTFRSPQSRENAVERPPRLAGGWTGAYVINSFVVAWVLVVGFGFGGWASITNFVQQVNTFGLFAKCYQCPPHLAAPPVPLAPPPMAPAPSMPPSMSFNVTGLFPPVPSPALAPSPMMHFFLRHHHHRHHGRHGL